jgi:hypothetical protein
VLQENRFLPAAPSWATTLSTVPSPNPGGGFSAYEAIDIKVQFYAQSSNPGYVDNLEARQ